jgi:hypothetical protein
MMRRFFMPSIAHFPRLFCLLVVTGLASSAAAQQFLQHPIAAGFRNVNGGSNMRFQIGGGLPLPVTPILGFGGVTTKGAACLNTAAATSPGGGPQNNCEARIFPSPGFGPLPGGSAPPVITQPATGPATGRSILIAPGVFAGGGIPVNAPVYQANKNLFQVQTNIFFQIPGPATGGLPLRKSGRTGPATVKFCPGLTATVVTGGADPNCNSPYTGYLLTGVPGRMVYTKTKNQFGGAAPPSPTVFGTADVALINKGQKTLGTYCKVNGCVVSFVYATPAVSGVQGATFGAYVKSPGKKAKRYNVNGITTGGAITSLGSYVGKALNTNVPTSIGGPWTTGMLTVTATRTADGISEMFTRTGSDNRKLSPGGGLSGNISLVTGAVSQRQFSKANANRGWMTLTLPEPGAVASAAGALLTLAVCQNLARRRRPSSRR